MSNPYREMCAELLLFSEEAGEICTYDGQWPVKSDPNYTLLNRAHALLDRPVSDLPTDEGIWDLFDWLKDEWESNNEGEFPLPLFARAVLASWGRPKSRPVPVSELPWKCEGWCNADGKCWLRRKCDHGIAWRLMAPASVFEDAMQIYYADALPANALPYPDADNV